MNGEPRILDTVRDMARLDSVSEARGVVRAVTGAMNDQFSADAWDLISPVIPVDAVGESNPQEGSEESSAAALFQDAGRRLELGTATSARYVRVVAEAISQALDPATLERLRHLLADEYLALFEVDHRGELTEEDGATPGARILDEGGEEAGDPGSG